MNEISSYHVENGNCYILVQAIAANREIKSLMLAIDLGNEKIQKIKKDLTSIHDDSIEYDRLQDALNDHEMMISDFEDRIYDLQNRPQDD
jgi:hypothetical protein